MSSVKKNAKSKFLTEELDDFIRETKYCKDPKTRKSVKRQPVEVDEDISEVINNYQPMTKKSKGDVDTGKLVRGKLVDVMENQINARKQGNDYLLNSLLDLIAQIKADNAALKSNQQKLTSALVKCIDQSLSAQDQKLKALNDIYSTFKKQVEGLIQRGGMKADDRPLWFDVYKAFPPITEPKFARPTPEIKPIRQILYKEDALRAILHGKGHGLGAVNLLVPGETPTKKLLNECEKLKKQGVSEEELIEKAVDAMGVDKREKIAARSSQTQTVNTNTATGQILSEANISEIFKEK